MKTTRGSKVKEVRSYKADKDVLEKISELVMIELKQIKRTKHFYEYLYKLSEDELSFGSQLLFAELIHQRAKIKLDLPEKFVNPQGLYNLALGYDVVGDYEKALAVCEICKIMKESGYMFPREFREVHERVARARKFEDLKLIDIYYPYNSIFKEIELMAKNNLPILIIGPTGSGKEYVARAIHHLSERYNKEFRAIDIPGLPDTLIQTELFGQVKSAFTGAADKKGLFEIAEGGTVLLDEIGDMKQELQANLLRFLDSKEYRRVGDTKVKKSDVRIIAATWRNLEEQTKVKEFREDLLARLTGMAVDLKITYKSWHFSFLPLVRHLILRNGGKNIRMVEPLAYYQLRQVYYLGSEYSKIKRKYVRKLSYLIQEAIARADGDILLAEHLPRELRTVKVEFKPFSVWMESYKPWHIQLAGNKNFEGEPIAEKWDGKLTLFLDGSYCLRDRYGVVDFDRAEFLKLVCEEDELGNESKLAKEAEGGIAATHAEGTETLFPKSPIQTLKEAIASDEKEYMVDVLSKTDWKFTKACKVLGMSFWKLKKKMKELNIQKP